MRHAVPQEAAAEPMAQGRLVVSNDNGRVVAANLAETR